MAGPSLKVIPSWFVPLYSATGLTGDGNSTIIPTIPGENPPIVAHFPYIFQAVGANITTDETLTLSANWYTNSGGVGGSLLTTFTALTASTLVVNELPPFDMTGWNGTNYAGNAMLFPYVQWNWVLAGTTKNMDFTVYLSYVTWTY